MGVLYSNNETGGSDLATRIRADGITPLAGFCYLLFVLLYFPCIATIAAIKQESGHWKWALFTICYTCSLAWGMSFIVYQVGSLLKIGV